MLCCSLCTLEPTLTTARDRAMPAGGYRTHLWLVRVASAWTLAGRAFCSPKYVAALSTWGLAFLRLSHSFRSTKDSAGLPTCEKARSKYDSSHVMAILLSVTLWFYLKTWDLFDRPHNSRLSSHTAVGLENIVTSEWNLFTVYFALMCFGKLESYVVELQWFSDSSSDAIPTAKEHVDGQDYDCFSFFCSANKHRELHNVSGRNDYTTHLHNPDVRHKTQCQSGPDLEGWCVFVHSQSARGQQKHLRPSY